MSLASGNQEIMKCRQYNYLGVVLDECMTLKQNVNNIFKKFSYKIYQLSKIKTLTNKSTRILIYKQTILPISEYVNTARDVEILQKLQNRCLRLCLDGKNPRDKSIDYLHQESCVNLLEIRRKKQLHQIMHSLKCNSKFKD